MNELCNKAAGELASLIASGKVKLAVRVMTAILIVLSAVPGARGQIPATPGQHSPTGPPPWAIKTQEDRLWHEHWTSLFEKEEERRREAAKRIQDELGRLHQPSSAPAPRHLPLLPEFPAPVITPAPRLREPDTPVFPPSFGRPERPTMGPVPAEPRLPTDPYVPPGPAPRGQGQFDAQQKIFDDLIERVAREQRKWLAKENERIRNKELRRLSGTAASTPWTSEAARLGAEEALRRIDVAAEAARLGAEEALRIINDAAEKARRSEEEARLRTEAASAASRRGDEEARKSLEAAAKASRHAAEEAVRRGLHAREVGKRVRDQALVRLREAGEAFSPSYFEQAQGRFKEIVEHYKASAEAAKISIREGRRRAEEWGILREKAAEAARRGDEAAKMEYEAAADTAGRGAMAALSRAETSMADFRRHYVAVETAAAAIGVTVSTVSVATRITPGDWPRNPDFRKGTTSTGLSGNILIEKMYEQGAEGYLYYWRGGIVMFHTPEQVEHFEDLPEDSDYASIAGRSPSLPQGTTYCSAAIREALVRLGLNEASVDGRPLTKKQLVEFAKKWASKEWPQAVEALGIGVRVAPSRGKFYGPSDLQPGDIANIPGHRIVVEDIETVTVKAGDKERRRTYVTMLEAAPRCKASDADCTAWRDQTAIQSTRVVPLRKIKNVVRLFDITNSE